MSGDGDREGRAGGRTWSLKVRSLEDVDFIRKCKYVAEPCSACLLSLWWLLLGFWLLLQSSMSVTTTFSEPTLSLHWFTLFLLPSLLRWHMSLIFWNEGFTCEDCVIRIRVGRLSLKATLIFDFFFFLLVLMQREGSWTDFACFCFPVMWETWQVCVCQRRVSSAPAVGYHGNGKGSYVSRTHTHGSRSHLTMKCVSADGSTAGELRVASGSSDSETRGKKCSASANMCQEKHHGTESAGDFIQFWRLWLPSDSQKSLQNKERIKFSWM